MRRYISAFRVSCFHGRRVGCCCGALGGHATLGSSFCRAGFRNQRSFGSAVGSLLSSPKLVNRELFISGHAFVDTPTVFS